MGCGGALGVTGHGSESFGPQDVPQGRDGQQTMWASILFTLQLQDSMSAPGVPSRTKPAAHEGSWPLACARDP